MRNACAGDARGITALVAFEDEVAGAVWAARTCVDPRPGSAALGYFLGLALVAASLGLAGAAA